MDKELLDILKSIQSDIKDLKIDVSGLKTDVTGLKDGQNRIEKKLDSVVERTADLTEFRTETRDKLDSISNEAAQIRKDMSNVEIITSSNWNYIAKLKAVK